MSTGANRTRGEIEADLQRTRQELTASVDELATMLHPKTQLAEAKKAVSAGARRSASRIRDAVRDVTARAKSGDPKVLGVIGGLVATTVVVTLVVRRR